MGASFVQHGGVVQRALVGVGQFLFGAFSGSMLQAMPSQAYDISIAF